MTNTADTITRLLHLDGICAELETAIQKGRGDVAAMRAEYRACQDEALALEQELLHAGVVFVDDAGWSAEPEP